MKIGNLTINCVISLLQTVTERFSSLFNKISNQGREFRKSQFPYSLVNCEKFRYIQWIGKNMFSVRKREFYFKPIGNSAHTTEFLTLRKFLKFYPRRHWKHFKFTFEQVQEGTKLKELKGEQGAKEPLFETVS